MLFNINELMIFGLPVMFNPVFVIPFFTDADGLPAELRAGDGAGLGSGVRAERRMDDAGLDQRFSRRRDRGKGLASNCEHHARRGHLRAVCVALR